MMGAKRQEIGEDRSHRNKTIIVLTHGSLLLSSELMALNNTVVRCWRMLFQFFVWLWSVRTLVTVKSHARGSTRRCGEDFSSDIVVSRSVIIHHRLRKQLL